MPTNFITRLQEVRSKIEALQSAELELMNAIIKESGHNKLGQATYDMDGVKVTIVTKENVTLDKEWLNKNWKETMPINRAYSYSLRQKEFNVMMCEGTAQQRKVLSDVVTTKPAKPVIKIGD